MDTHFHYPASLRLLFVIALISLSGCRAFNLRVAGNYYSEFAYARAIPNYEKVLRKEFNIDAASRLADSYRKTGNSLKAEIWYRRLNSSPVVSLSDRHNFAEVLMENGKYKEAGAQYRAYLEHDPTDKSARKKVQVCDSVHRFFEDTLLYNVTALGFNGDFESNFSPAFYKDGIAFVSDRSASGKSRELSPWTGKAYLDLFYTRFAEGNWIAPQLLKGDINGLYDEGPATFSTDFNTIYFTRMDYTGKSVEKNQKNLSLLKLFSGTFTGNTWKLSGPMPFNNPDYSVGHPSLSADGHTLYFVSDMPWGYGGTDIYKSVLKNAIWSDPVNLGPAVNSDGNEMFPFIAPDSVLYFASDGHLGLGGLDIFSSYWDGENWMKAENLQYPVNSSKDDFGYIVDKSNTYGYYSSNRRNNRDMIFGFAKNPPEFDFKLIAKDSKTGTPLKSFTLYSINRKGEKTQLVTGSNGTATASLNPNTDYRILIKSKGYFAATSYLSTHGLRKSTSFADTLGLVRMEINKPVNWLSIKFLKKESLISEGMGKDLDSLVILMNLNPEIEVEISTHTDSRGSYTDNIALTRIRAELIVEYLVQKGIARHRIIGIGYGEGKLVNQCRDGIFCIEEDHQANNRVEIKITGLSAK